MIADSWTVCYLFCFVGLLLVTCFVVGVYLVVCIGFLCAV